MKYIITILFVFCLISCEESAYASEKGEKGPEKIYEEFKKITEGKFTKENKDETGKILDLICKIYELKITKAIPLIINYLNSGLKIEKGEQREKTIFLSLSTIFHLGGREYVCDTAIKDDIISARLAILVLIRDSKWKKIKETIEKCKERIIKIKENGEESCEDIEHFNKALEHLERTRKLSKGIDELPLKEQLFMILNNMIVLKNNRGEYLNLNKPFYFHPGRIMVDTYFGLFWMNGVSKRKPIEVAEILFEFFYIGITKKNNVIKCNLKVQREKLREYIINMLDKKCQETILGKIEEFKNRNG